MNGDILTLLDYSAMYEFGAQGILADYGTKDIITPFQFGNIFTVVTM
jgi:hypothetical protein